MRMFAFTSKHHDGSPCLTRRLAFTGAPIGPRPEGRMEDRDLPYSMLETPFRRDVVGELSAAARKEAEDRPLLLPSGLVRRGFCPYNCAPVRYPPPPNSTRPLIRTSPNVNGDPGPFRKLLLSQAVLTAQLADSLAKSLPKLRCFLQTAHIREFAVITLRVPPNVITGLSKLVRAGCW